MTDEERNRRFENALTTLSELAANQEGRLAALERQAADFRRLFVNFRRLSVNHERRIGVIEEAFQTVVELIRRHDERMDEIRTAQRASQVEVDQKLAALIDAQMRTEEAHRRTEEAHRRTEEAQRRMQEAAAESERKIAALAESQEHSDERLNALLDVVKDLYGGRKTEGGTPDSG